MAPGVPGGRDVPGVAVMPGSTLPARLSIASFGEVPGPVSAPPPTAAPEDGWRPPERSTRRVAGGEPAGSSCADKKTPVIPLDEVVAGRYDESMHKNISIVSQSLGFLS